MGLKKQLIKLKKEMERVARHGDRVFEVIDDEMYIISKSERDQKKKSDAQRNLAVFIIAELLDSFENDEIEGILGIIQKAFEIGKK